MNDLFNKEKIIELFSQLDSVIYLNILKSVIIIFILWIIKKIFNRIIHRNVKNAKLFIPQHVGIR